MTNEKNSDALTISIAKIIRVKVFAANPLQYDALTLRSTKLKS